MNCPYCNFELTFCDKTMSNKQVAVCRNPECKYAGWHLPVEIFDELNAGKCVVHNLSVVREQFDRGYNTWVRSDKDLRQKLNQAQDKLKVARNLYQELARAYCEMVDDYRTTYGCLKTPEQETQEYMQEYDEKITLITKQKK